MVAVRRWHKAVYCAPTWNGKYYKTWAGCAKAIISCWIEQNDGVCTQGRHDDFISTFVGIICTITFKPLHLLRKSISFVCQQLNLVSPCISGVCLWNWSFSLHRMTKARRLRSCARSSYSCSRLENRLSEFPCVIDTLAETVYIISFVQLNSVWLKNS